MSLSEKIIKEKIWDSKGRYPLKDLIFSEDVKEFIKLLTRDINKFKKQTQLNTMSREEILFWVLGKMKRHAGEELIDDGFSEKGEKRKN